MQKLAVINSESTSSHQNIHIHLVHKLQPKIHDMGQWQLWKPQTLSCPQEMLHTGNKGKQENLSCDAQQSNIREAGHGWITLSLAYQRPKLGSVTCLHQPPHAEELTMPNNLHLQFFGSNSRTWAWLDRILLSRCWWPEALFLQSNDCWILNWYMVQLMVSNFNWLPLCETQALIVQPQWQWLGLPAMLASLILPGQQTFYLSPSESASVLCLRLS